MAMRIRKLFLLNLTLMVFTFLSCDSKKQSDKTTRIIVNIDDTEKLKYSDVFSKIEFLQLKVPPNEVVGNIGKVFFNKAGFIGLVDRRKRSVWLFNDNGDYINEIPVTIGKGPGEVLTFSDADFGSGERIHVLGAYRIITFNFEGELIDEVQLPFLTRSFKYLSNHNSFIAFMNNEISTTKGDQNKGFFNLYTFDDEGKIIERFLPFERNKTGLTRLLISNFYQFKGGLHHYSFLENNIYKIISPRELKIKYAFDYGENKIPEKLFDEKSQYQTGLSFLRKEVYAKDYVLLNTAMETQNYLVIGISYGDERGYLFYNKQSHKKKLTKASNFQNDFIPDLEVYFHFSHDDHIYGIKSASEIVGRINSNPNLKETNLVEIAEEISQNDGPVLIKAKLK